MQEEIIDKALYLLNSREDSSYKISMSTGISQTAIGRYKKGLSKPTLANANLLIQYFSKLADNQGTSIDSKVYGDGNQISGFNTGGTNSSVMSAPETEYKSKLKMLEEENKSLRSTIEQKDKIIEQKDLIIEMMSKFTK